MQALVVIAHPCGDSFTHAAAESAVRGLEAAGHTVDVIDLYAEGFVAALSLDERLVYETDAPILDPQVDDHARKVQGSQILVFVYPTWWSGLPAILKGWLDRVMVPGVAFEFDQRTGKIKPGLGHVRRIIGVSIYGSPRLYVKLINDNGRRTLTRSLRMSAGLRARTSWLGLYAIDTTTPEQRRDFLARVEQRMGSI